MPTKKSTRPATRRTPAPPSRQSSIESEEMDTDDGLASMYRVNNLKPAFYIIFNVY